MELNNRILSIKEELKRQKISYEKLSSLSGIPLATLKTIFRGKSKNPRIDTVEAIEQVIYFNYGNPYNSEKEINSQLLKEQPAYNLSDKERLLIENYRKLHPEMQRFIYDSVIRLTTTPQGEPAIDDLKE